MKQLSQQEVAEQDDEHGTKFVAQLREFRDIGGYSGVSGEGAWQFLSLELGCHSLTGSLCVQVFVCGSYPHWLMMTQRKSLHLHPMFIDGPIASFTDFHNVNCPHGFLYFSAEVWCSGHTQ